MYSNICKIKFLSLGASTYSSTGCDFIDTDLPDTELSDPELPYTALPDPELPCTVLPFPELPYTVLPDPVI
jgi:hypothetical protein